MAEAISMEVLPAAVNNEQCTDTVFADDLAATLTTRCLSVEP